MHKSLLVILVVAVLGAAIFFATQKEHTLERESVEEVSEVLDSIRYEPVIEYGMNLDNTPYCKDVIRKNEYLSDILIDLNISYKMIDKLSRETREVFDARHIRPGQTYCAIFDTTSGESLTKFFVYEKNKIDYVVYEFLEDSVVATMHQKPIEFRDREVSGIIDGSLYVTLQNQECDPYLAIELSEVYAWTIDFYRINKGDKFKVAFTEKYVDDEYVGIDNIAAALFHHGDKDLYAFFYETDSIIAGDYYDETGMSMRKAFLKAPVKYSRISSRYTMRRYHPVTGGWKAHLGTDYAAPHGTPIYTTSDGVITEAKFKYANGNYVKVRHNATYTTQYLHMSKIASGIKPGKFVKQGEVIGYVGSTGLATGPHVCYRFWKNGKQVDPYQQDLPEAEPIKEEHKAGYMKAMEVYKKQLDQIEYPEPEVEEVTEEETPELAELVSEG